MKRETVLNLILVCFLIAAIVSNCGVSRRLSRNLEQLKELKERQIRIEIVEAELNAKLEVLEVFCLPGEKEN